MANSPLGLNTENPVTSSRIKYTRARARAHTHTHTHTHTETHTEASPRGNAFKPKHKTPHRRRKGRRDPRAGAFLRLRPRAQRGPAPGAGARWDNPKTHRFVFKPQEKQAGAGEGKGRRDPSGRGNGEERKQRAALSSLPSDTGKSGCRSPSGGCRPAGSLPCPPAPRRLHARGAPP